VGFLAGLAIVVAFFSESVLAGFFGVGLMFVSAVVFERNLRRMGKAGWHDLTRKGKGEDAQPRGVAGTADGVRSWLRNRFPRHQP
jgi:hypothetical protein